MFRVRNGPATRQLIMDAVRKEPGVPLDRLRVLVGVSWTTCAYHLHKLEGIGAVQKMRRGKHAILYFPGEAPKHHVKWMSALRDDNAKRVLAAVKPAEKVGAASVCQRTGLSVGIVTRHLTYMVDGSVLAKQGDRRPRYFHHPELTLEAYQSLLQEDVPPH